MLDFLKKKELEHIKKLEVENQLLKKQLKEAQTVQMIESQKNEPVVQLVKEQKVASPEAQLFKEACQCYKHYMTLSTETRQNLNSVIQTQDAVHFLISGTQEDNIEALWDWLSYQLDTLSQEEQFILIETFYYFFTQYNQVTQHYELLNTKTGETFDEDKHTRDSQSKVSGSISQVLLEGYRNKRTQKMMKKAIVRVA